MDVVPLIKEKGNLAAPVFLILFAFVMPLSNSLKSIFLVCSIIAILVTPAYNKYLFDAFSTLWGKAAIAFFTFILIACFWSEAPYSMRWMVVGKYFKVIYLPIFTAGFINAQTRKWSINSYLLAIFITCIISFLKSINVIPPGGDPGEVFYNHIVTGFLVALGAYLSGLYAFETKGWPRILYVLMVCLTTYQVLFINTGRTGYIIYCILAALLLMQKLSIKKALLAVVIFSALIALAYTASNTMQLRVHDLLKDIKQLQHNNENTSLGYRIQFHSYAKALFESHPLIGIGTGGFKYRFATDNPVPAWGLELTDPHSQYWMMLAEQGLIGLLLLLFFLASLFMSAFKLTETRPILLGILISFCIGALSDTILCYSAAGYALVFMSALALGELLEKRA